MLAQLRGSADGAAPGVFRQLVLDLQKALPKVGPSRPVLAKDRVIAERIAKKAEAVEAAADRFGFVRMAGHAGDDRKVGIYGVADRYAVRRFDDAVIFLDPPRGLLGFEKRRPAPRGRPWRRGGLSRAASTPPTLAGEAFAPVSGRGCGTACRTSAPESRDTD